MNPLSSGILKAADLGHRNLQRPPFLLLSNMSVPEKYVRPAAAVVAVGIVLAVLRRRLAPSRPPYPPGPKGYPVIGNLLDFPKDPVWEGLAAMAKEHGERSVPLLRPFSRLWVSNVDELQIQIFYTWI